MGLARTVLAKLDDVMYTFNCNMINFCENASRKTIQKAKWS